MNMKAILYNWLILLYFYIYLSYYIYFIAVKINSTYYVLLIKIPSRSIVILVNNN